VLTIRPKFRVSEKGRGEQEFNNRYDSNTDPLLLFDKKVTMAVEGLEPFFDKILRKIPKANALIMAE
jgi:hypothetical protein